MDTIEENVFYRIKDTATDKYFDGGRNGVYCSKGGMRFAKMQPVTAALNHIEGERKRAVDMVRVWGVDNERSAYWQAVAEALRPDRWQVVKYKEVITVIEIIKTK